MHFDSTRRYVSRSKYSMRTVCRGEQSCVQHMINGGNSSVSHFRVASMEEALMVSPPTNAVAGTKVHTSDTPTGRIPHQSKVE